MSDFNTATFQDFVELADKIWITELKKINTNARGSGLFKQRPFPAGTGDTREFKEFDTNQYASNKDEGDQAAQSQIQIGFAKLMRLVRRAENVDITWEMRRRNKYDQAIEQIVALPEKIAGRLDLDLSHRLTFMTATTYTDMDGKLIDISIGDDLALASTAHELTGSSTQFRNILANNPKVSKGALEAMEKLAIENALDNFGIKKVIPLDIIWSTDDPNTMNTIKELLLATAEISSPNEGVPNVYQNKYKHVTLPRVPTTSIGAVDSSKAFYWGIASSQFSTGFLAVEDEPNMKSPVEGSNADDISTDDLTWKGRGSYGIVIVGARWIFVSKGNGDA